VSGPPAMPTMAASAAAPPITSGPPAMPTMAASAGAPPITSGPPAMPTMAASVGLPPITSGPPAMPTMAASAGASPITSGPPAMPTMAASAAASPITSGPPAMPTMAASIGAPPITSGPPAMPGVAASATAPPTMPTLAGEPTGGLVPTAPPAMPTMAGAPPAHHLPPSLPPARYQLGNEIARGGMGRVVDATDTMLGRVVAFKEALTRDVDTLRRFEREIQITARLEHPSIVPVHDAGESSNGAPFYVMRKVSGQPLERLVAAAETLNQRLALIPHIVDSAQAIAHAHERGIVHRDIKPSNILVGDLGETVVIDWGLAKVMGEPDEQTTRPLVDLADSLKTRAGIVYGTPGFMAPEQLRGAPVNEGCDVYALGATLYHLLSRKPPHHAKTADEMMKAAVAAPPTPIRELVAGVPLDLSTIVDKALAHDPKVRYHNARALAEDLQRFLTGQLVASHHYSPREKLRRFIRKNRGVSAAVAALVLVGTFSVIRIVRERNRADDAAHEAHAQELIARQEAHEKELRAEALTLSQARFYVDLNPTKAVAMVKPLVAKYWREARAIGAAARSAGVAWGIPVSRHTESLEMSHDGLRALSAGSDGVVRIHDLANHTTRPVIDLGDAVMARFADDDRQIVAWHDTRLVILDPATGKRRDLTMPEPIIDLEVVGITAYWIDRQHAMWQLDLAGTAPVAVALPERVHAIAPSPDGRWLALSGDDHLLLYDRTQPEAPTRQVLMGEATDVAWSANGDDFAALVEQSLSGQSVIGVTMTPEPRIIHRQMAAHLRHVAHAGGLIYTFGPNGVSVLSRSSDSNEPLDRQQVSGAPVGMVAARGGAAVAAATAGLMMMSADGDRVMPLQGAHIQGVVASPRSPYVIAELEGRLLVWNLDDIQPRKLADAPAGGAQFASADQILTGGTTEEPAQAIDVATGAAHELGPWLGLRQVSAASRGLGIAATVALIDDARHLHLIVPGRAIEDLPEEVDLAGFATPDQLVFATPDGALYVRDIEHRQQTPLIQHHARLLGVAWGRGHHPWIAAAFVDGTLWRKNLATGVEATIARVPRLELDHLAQRDGKLLVAADGTVTFLHDAEVHVWHGSGAAAGTITRLARAARTLEDFGEAGAGQLVAFSADHTVYTIASDAPDRVIEAIPSLDASQLSMSPDTGLFVVLDHGTIRAVDPIARQQWTVAAAISVQFAAPRISPDGRRILARTSQSLLVWSLELPDSPEATARWLDAMTNAVDDTESRTLGWH
jgi:serine/threonine protein kinase/WD40 repeat protein